MLNLQSSHNCWCTENMDLCLYPGESLGHLNNGGYKSVDDGLYLRERRIKHQLIITVNQLYMKHLTHSQNMVHHKAS